MAFTKLFTSSMAFSKLFTSAHEPPIPPNAFDHPTVADVLVVKAILIQTSLPLELIDAIIDYAEYWPHTSAPIRLLSRAGEPFNPNYFLTRTLPLGCLPTSPSTDPNLAPKVESGEVVAPYTFVPPTQSEESKTATAALLKAWARSSKPRDAHPCRKIVFSFRSHDQGWGGKYKDRGTYNGSYTWLDVGKEKARVVEDEVLGKSMERLTRGSEGQEVEKMLTWNVESVDPPIKQSGGVVADGCSDTVELAHPFLPHDNTLQKNRTATSQQQNYVIIWRWDDNIDPESAEAEALMENGRGRATGNGEFVRNLEIGDVVTLWARARFAGWQNTVEDVGIDMFWAV